MKTLVVTEWSDVPMSAIPDEIGWGSLLPNTWRAYRPARRRLDTWLKGRQLFGAVLAEQGTVARIFAED